MSVQKTLTLDISNFNNKVDTVYTKSSTNDLEVAIYITNNGRPYTLPRAAGTSVALLSNSVAYQESSDFPIEPIEIIDNKAVFNLYGAYICGWTTCSIRITDSENNIVETQNFQVYCEESPTGDEGTLELSISARIFLEGLFNEFASTANAEIDEFITEADSVLAEIDAALNDLIGDDA